MTIKEMAEELDRINNRGGNFGFLEMAYMHNLPEETEQAMVAIACYWEDGWGIDDEEAEILKKYNLLTVWGTPKKFTERWYWQALKTMARNMKAEGVTIEDLLRY